MKEYIEREAAVKEYCLDMCGHEYEADLCGKCNYPLRNVPSADVRPVVFCRECRRAEQDDSGAPPAPEVTRANTEIKGSDRTLEAKIMMFKCCECGHLFEDGEQAEWYENQGECHGVTAMERFSGCPVCKGDYEEVYRCKKCGDWHTEDELYDGWCEKCLRESINYDTFFEYCEANKGEKYLDIFVMADLLGGMDCPDNISPEFHQLVVETYKRRVANAKLLGEKFGFLEDCIRFIMDDDGSIGRENYADWLNKRKEVK